LKGHNHRVYCLQFKGNNLVSGSDDQDIKLWNIEEATCKHTFSGHTRAVRTLQFNEEGSLVSGSYDKTIRVWDMWRGEEKALINQHSTCVCVLKINEALIASGSYRVVKLFDTKQTFKPVVELAGHNSWVTTLQFDDLKLVSGSMDNTIKIWDLRKTAYPYRVLGEHAKRVRCLQYDGRKLCTGSMDFTIKIWDLDKWDCVATLKGHNASARSLHFTDDVLVSGSIKHQIWDFTADVPFE